MTIKPLEKRVYLSSPTMHGDELKYMTEAYDTNWMSTVGENINEVERIFGEMLSNQYGVGLSCGTAALHLAAKLAGERLYGKAKTGHGALEGKKLFCSDMTFAATVNPMTYEGGVPVYIDSEYESWNMDPEALRRAFELYPEVKLVVLVNLYGTPAKLEEIVGICKEHGAVMIEDAAESLGATYKGRQTGTFGAYNIISFNGNKIITGSSGGMLLTPDKEAADLARKWSTQSRENAPWYQHEWVGYNYRMSNVIAGVIRGQASHLHEHIAQKRAIYERYKEGLADLPVRMNPIPEGCVPNYWLSCLTVNKEAMCRQTMTDCFATYVREPGKSCPAHILEALARYNAEGRPIWKPMHMQPIYAANEFITARDGAAPVNEDIFERGLCLPSDNKMTEEEQDVIIRIIRECFEAQV
ncbi:MAG: DegT/DnrJ/EryC1/StrS family aminotransferase [Lachnospiraceae bacterium]|jgi:dTDP-4-amino-4,6-dideoxygalactose transaminase